MNVTENKNEATETTATATAAKKKLPLWGKILLVVVIVLAALAGLATLYVNGKLDLLHYNDGSVDSMGTIDADEDQDLDGSGLVHSDDEMTMPEGSPFADDFVRYGRPPKPTGMFRQEIIQVGYAAAVECADPVTCYHQ